MRMQQADHSPPMASDTSTHPCMLTCKRVLQCESTCVAGEARTRAACVTSVLCTRVVVYRAQRGERGIGGGEDEAVAKPDAYIKNQEECKNQEEWGMYAPREKSGRMGGELNSTQINSLKARA